MPGPTSSGFKPPSGEKYKCPMKNCKTEPKGYVIFPNIFKTVLT